MHSTSHSPAPPAKRRPVAWLAILFLGGCATAGSVRDAPLSEGEARPFTADYQVVVKATHDAILDLGLSVEENRAVDDQTWMVIGKNGANLTSWGEYVRFVIVKQKPQGAIVRLYSKRAYSGNVTARDDYKELFDRIGAKVGPPPPR